MSKLVTCLCIVLWCAKQARKGTLFCTYFVFQKNRKLCFFFWFVFQIRRPKPRSGFYVLMFWFHKSAAVVNLYRVLIFV
ncbi:hypothetical protein O6H91_21G050100 [Diphasiastrum complanatum]|uniref:Uncharacterized protein n=1 Tax=Diphasiastrum complanatum TaxID=34168 RepID=A0ACC2AKB4_DIPCM|nr:hypothetical protein O6H91_21G050100 [Diphasiastrum complanatum]